MSKICFCDIDNTLADNTERETQARQFADSRFVPELGIIPSIVYRDAWMKIFYSERAFYNPELLALDTLIDGVLDVLTKLTEAGYTILFLTSRPESLRIATRVWLYERQLGWFDEGLIMKSSAFQYVKTPVWKAGMVATLAAMQEVIDVLVVDDSEEVIEAVRTHNQRVALRCASSLSEAVALLKGESQP